MRVSPTPADSTPSHRSGRAPRALPALLALAGLALAAAAHAQATTPIPRTFFAISPIHVGDFPAESLGTIGHPPFLWGNVEVARDSFDFSKFDTYLADADAHGLVDTLTRTVHMAVTLGLTPRWAVTDTSTCTHTEVNGGTQCSAPPDSLNDWAVFLTHLVQHYNGVTEPHIQYYELWNEADDTLWWNPPAAQEFSRLVQMAVVADTIIHKDPCSKLLTPSVTGGLNKCVSWMSTYLKAGGALHADGGAFHGYIGGSGLAHYPMPESDAGFASIITKANAMRAVFDTCGLAGRPMYQTEGSWGNFNVTQPDSQVAWIARYELLQAGLRASDDLQMASWFCWGDSAFGWGDLETRAGTPNAAAVAYGQVYQWLAGAYVPLPCAESSNSTWTCTITRPGTYVAQAVWNSAGPNTYTPGAGYTRYRDLTGASFPIPVSGAVPIGAEPVLIESGVAAGVPPPIAVPVARLRASPSVMRGATRFQLAAALDRPARLVVFDVTGRVVRALDVPPRAAAVEWDGTATSGARVASGLYFVRLVAGATRDEARVVVLR